MRYLCDFETTTKEDENGYVHVWLWCAASDPTRKKKYIYKTGRNIDDFIDYVTSPIYEYYTRDTYKKELDIYGNKILSHKKGEQKEVENNTVEFFNLPFDMSFIYVALAKRGVVFKEGSAFDFDDVMNLKDKEVISTLGTVSFYSIVLCLNGIKTTFRDMRLYCGGKLADWGKIFNIPKGVTPLLETLPETIEAEWEEYIKRDCEIMVKIHEHKVLPGMTTGGMALQHFKECLFVQSHSFFKDIEKETNARKQWNEYANAHGLSTFSDASKDYFLSRYPIQDAHIDFLKQGYRGGYTRVNPDYAGKEVKNIRGYDIVSSYPTQMYFKMLPYGDPIEVERIGKELWIALVTIIGTFNEYPTLLIDGAYPMVLSHTLVITSVDYERLMKAGEFDVEFITIYEYKSNNTSFRKYIDHWIKVKEESEKGSNERQNAKLMLNSLYGKFGSMPKALGKRPKVIDDTLKFESMYTKKATVYMPLAMFITAYAREKLFDIYDKVGYKNIIYSDTDSVYTTKELPDSEIGDSLGCWSLEGEYSRGLFMKPKVYKVEKNGKAIVKYAGVNADFSSNYDEIDLVNGKFEISRSKQVPGGKLIYKTIVDVNKRMKDFFEV